MVSCGGGNRRSCGSSSEGMSRGRKQEATPEDRVEEAWRGEGLESCGEAMDGERAFILRQATLSNTYRLLITQTGQHILLSGVQSKSTPCFAQHCSNPSPRDFHKALAEPPTAENRNTSRLETVYGKTMSQWIVLGACVTRSWGR